MLYNCHRNPHLGKRWGFLVCLPQTNQVTVTRTQLAAWREAAMVQYTV